MQIAAKPELSTAVAQHAEVPSGSNVPVISTFDVLAMMPRGLKFLFLDEILEVSSTHISASYRFREDAFFYEGHFPDRPVTPGTVLLEAMCQCGITAHSYYLLAQEMGIEKSSRHRVLFTNSEAEWFELVSPGDLIIMRSELLAWRLKRIRARVKMFSTSNTLIAQSTLAGTSVSWHPGDAPKSSLHPASDESAPTIANSQEEVPNES